jgi:hypothetical protein
MIHKIMMRLCHYLEAIMRVCDFHIHRHVAEIRNTVVMSREELRSMNACHRQGSSNGGVLSTIPTPQ